MNGFIKIPKLDGLFAEYTEEVSEVAIDDGFDYGSTNIGNTSHAVSTVHPHIRIGPCNLVGHTHGFRGATTSVYGNEALIRGTKVIALMGLELIIDRDVYQDIIEERAHLKGNGK